MKLMEAIAARQSCRAYSGEQLTAEQLSTILQAANAAPVALRKFADVKLTVVQDQALIAKIDAIGLAMMAKQGLKSNHGDHPTYCAPTLIVVCGKKTDGPLGAVPYCNASCIIENMMLAATDLGLGSVYILGVTAAIRDDQDLCAELKVPQDFFPVAMMAVGQAADTQETKILSGEKFTVDIIK